jgi:hypothetical protein
MRSSEAIAADTAPQVADCPAVPAALAAVTLFYGLRRTQQRLWLYVIFGIWGRFRMEQESDPVDSRRDLLEQLQPFAGHCRLEIDDAGDVAAGRGRLSTKPLPTGSATTAKMMGMVRVCCSTAACGPPPTKFLESLLEFGDEGLSLSVALSIRHQDADPPHALGLLRARPERPGDQSTADQKCDLASSNMGHGGSQTPGIFQLTVDRIGAAIRRTGLMEYRRQSFQFRSA